MTGYVIDASVMGPLIFEDEAAGLIEPMIEAIESGEVTVPAHWRLEISNMVLMGSRRGRALKSEVAAILSALTRLPIAVDQQTVDKAWGDSHRLAVRHALTAYDAAYLELALRLSATLITTDVALSDAARAENVGIISA